jgi:hypothetical protein
MTQTAPGTGAPDQQARALLDEGELRALQEAGRAWADVPRASPAGSDGNIDPDLDLTEERGSRPGEHYVRIVRPKRQGFERVAPGWLQATPRASEPRTRLARRMAHARRRVLGSPLDSRSSAKQRLSKLLALAILSSDAPSSPSPAGWPTAPSCPSSAPSSSCSSPWC